MHAPARHRVLMTKDFHRLPRFDACYGRSGLLSGGSGTRFCPDSRTTSCSLGRHAPWPADVHGIAVDSLRALRRSTLCAKIRQFLEKDNVTTRPSYRKGRACAAATRDRLLAFPPDGRRGRRRDEAGQVSQRVYAERTEAERAMSRLFKLSPHCGR